MNRIAKVTRNVVEGAGVDVDHLIGLPVKNAAAEPTTFSSCTILRANLIGLDGETITEVAETARIEDRNHFEALVPRIHELGGRLPGDMVTFHTVSGARPPPSVLGSLFHDQP